MSLGRDSLPWVSEPVEDTDMDEATPADVRAKARGSHIPGEVSLTWQPACQRRRTCPCPGMEAALGDRSGISRTGGAFTHTGQVSLGWGIGAQALRWSQCGREHSHTVCVHREQMTWAPTSWGDLSSTSDPEKSEDIHARNAHCEEKTYSVNGR